MTNAGTISIGVCICTRNRPEELRRALHSVERSSVPPACVVVADDSTDETTCRMMEDGFKNFTYVRGPRRGLGANRNTALRHARGTHVLFLDDDVVLDKNFLQNAASALMGEPPNTILTGVEIQNGRIVAPSNVSFLGYQKIPYLPGATYETLVINAAVFPRRLFARTRFDENLVYGCDEIDLTVRAMKLHGHVILFKPDISNSHFPANSNRTYYVPTQEASRIYVMFKRYAWVEKKRLKALIFLAIAYAHMLLHSLKYQGFAGLPSFLRTLKYSATYIARCWVSPERYL